MGIGEGFEATLQQGIKKDERLSEAVNIRGCFVCVLVVCSLFLSEFKMDTYLFPFLTQERSKRHLFKMIHLLIKSVAMVLIYLLAVAFGLRD